MAGFTATELFYNIPSILHMMWRFPTKGYRILASYLAMPYMTEALLETIGLRGCVLFVYCG